MEDLDTLKENNTRINLSGFPYYKGRFRRTTGVTLVRSNLVEVAVEVEIMDRVTLGFEGESEIVKTYIADMVETEE